ncbi:CLK1 kinase, partial [Upupa epops]|nr:CLK1 kinase [Upupa epops]
QKSHPRKRSRSLEEDKKGHLICQSRAVLSARYKIFCTLGEGTFGKVVECTDHKAEDRHVDEKIIKTVARDLKAAYTEIQVLEHLNALDPSNTYYCVKMLDWFECHGYICIVFELLGLSIYDFIKENGFLPLRLDHIRHMAYRICKSVNCKCASGLLSLLHFLHRICQLFFYLAILYLNKLTHTDLKPENTVFVTSDSVQECNSKLKCEERTLKNPNVRIVDFGSATYNDKYHSTLVSTRLYRAPEVILALGWSRPCDVWSIGCILMEYITLESHLFPTHHNKEHLAMMEQMYMIQKSRKCKYFCHDQLNWDKCSSAGSSVSRHCKLLKVSIHDSDHENLFDLIEKMLEYDPDKRITLEEALRHPFFFYLHKKRSLSLKAEQADTGTMPPKCKK